MSEARRVSVGGTTFELTPHHCFACGDLNERGLRLRLHLDEGRCWTELTLGRDFEGWDGIAHGGILAAILDEVMAWALIAADAWGLTASMTIDFKRPAPVDRPIRAEGWLTEARRRLLRTEGRIVDAASGELLTRGRALYVAAAAERKEELKRRYGFRLVPAREAPR